MYGSSAGDNIDQGAVRRSLISDDFSLPPVVDYRHADLNGYGVVAVTKVKASTLIDNEGIP